MEDFYSKVEPDRLLHVVNRLSEISDRKDIIDPNNFIQCSSLKMKKGKTFRPHKHIVKTVIDYDRIAQESWVIIHGSVKCVFYDVDDTILATPILYAGDASFTLAGGHNYIILEDDTIVYEYKTGKYTGQENDKTFINE